MKKIIYLKDFNKISTRLKNKKTVLVGGCYELLHYGHLVFLNKAKRAGDYLIIALESDDFIKLNKHKNIIHNQIQRAEILASLLITDLIIMLPFFPTDKQYSNMVKIIKPDIIAISEDDKQKDNKLHQAQSVGAKLLIVTPRIKEFSSSKILKNL